MSFLRALWRLLYFVIYSAHRVAKIVIASLLPGATAFRNLRLRQRWAAHLLPAIGIRIEVQGRPPDFPCIVMGNHRSYLDPVLLIGAVPNAYPVSKAEVAKWPIIGYGARVSGIIFLQRDSMQSRRITLQGIAEQVRAGFSVLLFPEGTTQAQPQTTPFKLGGFRLAVENNIPIVPVAIEYRDPADYWIGDDTFMAHFFRRFRQPQLYVYLHFGPRLQHTDAQILLRETQKWIDAELLVIRAGF